MSRVGKLPIEVPSDVKVDLNNNSLTITGKNGSLSKTFVKEVTIEFNGTALKVTPKGEDNQSRAYWGLTRALINNMVKGVSVGFTKVLEIKGVGYRAAIIENKYVKVAIGYSDPRWIEIPAGIKVECRTPTVLVITGNDNQKVGEFASVFKKLRRFDPYKGKGIIEEGKEPRRKEGKKK